MNESDLLIVIGASFSNHTGIAPYKPIVQIDDDHAAIGRFDAVSADVLGDAAITMTALTDALGIRVTSRDELDDAMSTLFASDGPRIVVRRTGRRTPVAHSTSLPRRTR